MHLNINLSTRPYEDAQQFWLRWGVGLGALGILTLALLAMTVTGWFNASRDRAKIRDLQAQIINRDQQRSDAQAFLQQPANYMTRDKSQFLNDLIQRKSFSWTRAFEDLEKVMPPRLHVISMRPEMTPEGQLEVRLVVAGDSRERALDLARRMEHSPHFQQTQITQEAQTGTTNGADAVQFNISALYIPEQPARSSE